MFAEAFEKQILNKNNLISIGVVMMSLGIPSYVIYFAADIHC
jgi:hypothetical protein